MGKVTKTHSIVLSIWHGHYDFIGKLKNYILLNINMSFQKPGNKMAKE